MVFCAFFDTHAQMPILSPYAISLGADPFAIGLVIGAYSFFNIIGNFTGGAAVDKKGWNRPLLAGLFGVALFLYTYTLAESAFHLILIRSGHGLMGGILVPAALACLITDHVKTGNYSFRMALFGATVGLAAVTGPMAAGLTLNKFGYNPVYYGLAVLLLIAALVIIPYIKKQPACWHNQNTPEVAYKAIFSRPRLQSAFLYALGTMGATGTLAAFLPLRASSLGFNPAHTGALFSAFALTAIVIQLFWPRIFRPVKNKNKLSCHYGLLFICFALAAAGFATTFSGLLAALILYGAGFGLSFQGMLSLVLEGSELAFRGKAIGLFFAAYSLGAAIAPPLGGLIWQSFPVVFPFYTAAALTLLSLSAGNRHFR